MRRWPSFAGLIAGLALVTGCTPSGSATSGPPSPNASSPDASSSIAPSSSAGCPAGGESAPAGVVASATVDVDGDGRADEAWIADIGGQRILGITTASGDSMRYTFQFAGPQAARALVVRPTGELPADILLSDGRSADLLVVGGCAIRTVTDAKGVPYAFDLGFGEYGTGVGCLDLTGEGRASLVGFNARDENGSVTLTRTAVVVDGTTAHAGVSDTLTAPDPAAIASAHAVTCGDLTLADDGAAEATG